MTKFVTNTNNAQVGGMSSAASIQGRLKRTRQLTSYQILDDGELQTGLPHSYTVLNTGQFTGTTNVNTHHYTGTQISFTAPNTVSDVAAGLATILTNDIVVIQGSALNDGVYNVAGGGVAGSFTTVENTIVNEAAGPYVSISKRSTPSNNCVIDNITGLMWKRYAAANLVATERIGPGSDGQLYWFNGAISWTLHPAAADLQMIAPSTLRIVNGAGEVARYWPGMLINCTGFANAVNNRLSYPLTAVTVNGADLDLTLYPSLQTLISEAAAGARSIICLGRHFWNYIAYIRTFGFAGYYDWRLPNQIEMLSILDQEAPSSEPDSTAFPNWQTGLWYATSNTTVNPTANDQLYSSLSTQLTTQGKLVLQTFTLVRG